jgi:hypothetical protein
LVWVCFSIFSSASSLHTRVPLYLVFSEYLAPVCIFSVLFCERYVRFLRHPFFLSLSSTFVCSSASLCRKSNFPSLNSWVPAVVNSSTIKIPNLLIVLNRFQVRSLVRIRSCELMLLHG